MNAARHRSPRICETACDRRPLRRRATGGFQMNRQLTTYGLRFARRHPIRAMRLGTMAMEGRRRTLLVVVPVRRAMTDPKVHAETRRATAEARRAALRVQRVGIANALTDRQVARKLRRASGHVSRAASLAVRPPRHRARNATLLVVGAGVLAGVAYGGREKYSRSNSEDWSTPTADRATPAADQSPSLQPSIDATPTPNDQANGVASS